MLLVERLVETLARLAMTPAWSGGVPSASTRELLTEDEAIRYLRLDTINIADPAATLRRYRALGHLRGTQVSKRVFYRVDELRRFLEHLTDSNPR